MCKIKQNAKFSIRFFYLEALIKSLQGWKSDWNTTFSKWHCKPDLCKPDLYKPDPRSKFSCHVQHSDISEFYSWFSKLLHQIYCAICV